MEQTDIAGAIFHDTALIFIFMYAPSVFHQNNVEI